MKVAEVMIDVPVSARREAERAAYALGAQGIEVRDRDHGVAAGRVHVVLWLPAATSRRALERAVGKVADARVRVRRVEATWWTPPPPRKLGRRFVVIADGAKVRDRIAIRVDAALTFGDGQHATTALCVAALERAIGPNTRSLLDVGTGTGVLAIVAAKLGVPDVVATDIDPLARETARGALRANGVRARVQSALPSRRFECVVANLYLEPLLALAGELAARVEVGGALIVSGFTQEAIVAKAFARAGLTVRARHSRGGWVCLELRATRPPRTAQKKSARP